MVNHLRRLGECWRSAFGEIVLANISLPKWRSVKAIALTAVMLLCTFVTVLIILVGRIPVRGNISVSVGQSDRFKQIMKENGIMFWTGIGRFGMMQVHFDNPFALTAVDDAVLEDARRNKYQAVVEYKCLIPYFDYSVTAD